ncbi:hypothetical protein Tco_1342747, partial [Tanacetum coccineum]
MSDGEWVDDPNRVKDEFRAHFATRFKDPGPCLGYINYTFPNRLKDDQVADQVAHLVLMGLRSSSFESFGELLVLISAQQWSGFLNMPLSLWV